MLLLRLLLRLLLWLRLQLRLLLHLHLHWGRREEGQSQQCGGCRVALRIPLERRRGREHRGAFMRATRGTRIRDCPGRWLRSGTTVGACSIGRLRRSKILLAACGEHALPVNFGGCRQRWSRRNQGAWLPQAARCRRG
jgi:hypothetical protein